MVQIQDKFITLNGLRFHYRDWGKEGAPALIALHGLTFTDYAWDTTARGLCDRYRVLALDQRGHGETEWAKEYKISNGVGDLDAFGCALGLKKFAIVGHSMGSLVTYNYAPSHPDQVEQLVSVDFGPEIMLAFGQRLCTSMQANDIFNDPEEALSHACG